MQKKPDPEPGIVDAVNIVPVVVNPYPGVVTTTSVTFPPAPTVIVKIGYAVPVGPLE